MDCKKIFKIARQIENKGYYKISSFLKKIGQEVSIEQSVVNIQENIKDTAEDISNSLNVLEEQVGNLENMLNQFQQLELADDFGYIDNLKDVSNYKNDIMNFKQTIIDLKRSNIKRIDSDKY